MNQIIKLSLWSLLITILFSCAKPVHYNINDWDITLDAKRGTLDFSHNELGLVIKNVHLQKGKGEESFKIKGWKAVLTDSMITLSFSDPENIIKINVSHNSIDFESVNSKIRIQGMAPAGEKRIPARIASQDNDVMYTQMGFVSATNIYHLFDMKTDIMIGFPKGSQLERNNDNQSQMNVDFAVADGSEINLIHDYFTEFIGLGKNKRTDFKPVFKPISGRFKTAPTGWSSWYCYYMSPTEESLMLETDALAHKLKPYGLTYVQLDAAYTRGKDANWLNWNKELYPHGGKYWFKHVLDQGLKPGLWLNIHGANYARPSIADQYPENYFLRDKKGKLSPACCSADTTVVRLDYTNPEVIDKHLKPLFKTLVNNWGLSYLKAGGWGRWMDFYEKNREKAFDPKMDSREIYRETIKTVRGIMGDQGYLLGCAMHEIGVGFDYFDGSRTGRDDYAQWSGKNHWTGGMQQFFQSLFGANFINGISWWSDPDDVMVRDPLTLEEGKTIVSTISLSGQAYIISDFIADFSKERREAFLSSQYFIGWAKKYPGLVKPLQPEKLELYKKTMPAMPIRAMDLYPYKTKADCCTKPKSFPKALDLKVNAATGQYDVVSMYNWSDTDTLQTLKLDTDLGLKPEKDYLAFDFWNNKLIKIENAVLQQQVPAHGTCTVILRTDKGTPQILATSRHITAAKSIQSVTWDQNKKILSGVSETVPGDLYSLYVFIPDGMHILKASVLNTNVNIKQIGENLFKMSFTGKEKSLAWELSF